MSNAKYPIVSVIMATYNEPPKILKKAVDSVLGQSFDSYELLIMDDSTNPDTIHVLDTFKTNEKVHIIRKDFRMGLSRARNIGIHISRGNYIAIMDADDISLPERFRLQVDYLNRHPSCFVLGGQINIIDYNDNIISYRRYPLKGLKLKLFSSFRNPVAHPTVMFRKEIVKEGLIYNEKLTMSEDLDLWLRVMNSNYRIENLDEVLINYRVDETFTDKRVSKNQKEYMAYVRKMNWSNKHMFFSMLSYLSGQIFKNMPTSYLTILYEKENNQKVKR